MMRNLLAQLRRPVSAVLASAVVMSCITLSLLIGNVYAAADDDNSEFEDNSSVQEYRDNIADLLKKQAEIEKEISSLKDDVDDFITKKARYDALVAICDEKIAVGEDMLADMKQQEAEIVANIEAKTAVSDELYEQVKERIVISYESGGIAVTYLEFIFNSDNVIELLEGIEHALSLIQYDTRLMRDYRNITAELEEEHERLRVSISEQEALIASLEEEREAAQEVAVQALSYIDDAMANMASKEDAARKLKEDREAADKMLDDLIDQLMREREEEKNNPPETTEPPATQPPETKPPETKPPETKPPETKPPETKPPETESPETKPPETNPLETESPETDTPPETGMPPETDTPPENNDPPEDDGEFMWPLDPKHTRITSVFGPRSDPFGSGVVSNHGGTDIAAPRGSNIYASRGGKIVRAAEDSSYGNYIMIDHGDGMFTLYAHCDKLLVSEGTYVEKGTVIALVGSTGNSTGYHLHFEVRVGRTKVDALDYVKVPGT